MYLQLILAAFPLLLLLYFCFTRNLNYWSKRGVPGPKPLPFFGNILDNFKTPINILEVERLTKYGRIYGFLEFSQPTLTIAEPELLKQVTMKDFYAFPNRVNEFPSDPIFSKLLSLIKDDDWRRIRSITSCTFTTKKLKQMMPLIDSCVKNVVERLESVEGRQEIDPKVIFGAFTLEVIAKCSFAIEVNGHKEPNHPFLINVRKACNFKSLRVLLLHLIPKKLQKFLGCQVMSEEVVSYFTNAIDAIVKQRRIKTNKSYKDFVQLLLEAEITNDERSEELKATFKDEEATEKLNQTRNWQKRLNEDEIVATGVIFLFAGYETTSSALNYCFYALAMNQNVQQILFEEIKNYFSRNQELDYDSLIKLVYLDAFVNETLRMYSPVVHFDRVASIDYKLGDTGIIIPKGTVINLPFYALHHDPEFYPEPFVFKPERFLPENRDNIKHFTFIPFGYGPRMCIAQRFALLEMKMVLSHLVYRFKFVKTAKTPEVPKFNSKKMFLLCEPYYIRVEKR